MHGFRAVLITPIMHQMWEQMVIRDMTMSETLNQQVHRLLGKCWHEINFGRMQCGSCDHQSTAKQFSKRKEDYYCPKCKDIDCYRNIYYVCKYCFVPLDGEENTAERRPNYKGSLDVAWECVEYMRIELKLDVIIQRYVHSQLTGVNLRNFKPVELTCYDNIPAIAICNAFIHAMGEEPVNVSS